MTSRFELRGFDGANPLAFLAAVGTLQASSLAFPDCRPRLDWNAAGQWVPNLTLDRTLTREDFVHGLHRQLSELGGHPCLGFADNLTLPRAQYRAVCESLRESASLRNRCGV